jgi:hypothetical protein
MSIPSGLTLGQIFSRAIDLCRPAFGSVFVGIILPLGLLQGVLAAGSAMLQTTGRMAGPGVIFGSFALIGMTLVVLVVAIVGAGATGHAAYTLAKGGDAVSSESWREGLRPRVWGTLILSGIGIGLGLVCCLLPGIYAALVWAIVLPIVFDESLGFTRALSRSYELMNFNPQGGIGNDPKLRAFLILLSTVATTYLLSFMIQLPLVIVSAAAVARSMSAGETPGEFPALVYWLQVPTSIAVSIVQSSLVFLSSTALAVMYFDIRGRREATDLDAAVTAIGAPKGV